ncbi:hypothetical protein OH720_04305 [Pseudomonas sp. WJP1]|uniref:hypothetical protein n=1 Tax=Pseudomonas sp. WJP1 TaxID=2986947 RepID=UPI0023498254|nr:hypothetical protein [Pseudomonas sp. WJP1]WCM52249.1 hypothetical protein OH720_04305 [Pseudomonas sp. WJP1]
MSTTTGNTEAFTLNSETNGAKTEGSATINLASYGKDFSFANVSTRQDTSLFEIFAINDDKSYGLTLKLHKNFDESEDSLRAVYQMHFWARQTDDSHYVYALVHDKAGRIRIKLNDDRSINEIDFKLNLKFGVDGPLDWSTGQIKLNSK